MRIPLSNADGDPYYRLIGHRPEILAAWAQLDIAFLGPSSKVDLEIKEEARRALAQNVGCAYCATLGGLPRADHPDPKEALAVAFAQQLAKDYREIDDSTFDALREEFSTEEIVELVSWLCFKFGSNLFGALMKLNPATKGEMKGYSDFIHKTADKPVPAAAE
jgi:alkylhydroperoxidase family enzyme